MKQCFGLVSTGLMLFLLIPPLSGLAQREAGIPPMLESQRPLAVPDTKPQPRPPDGDQVNSTPQAQKGTKGKKTRLKKSGKRKATLVNQQKGKAGKRKGQATTTGSKSGADRS